MSQLQKITLEASGFWAIQIDNSAHRTWEQSETHALVKYDWKHIDANKRSTQKDTLIAVAQRYPEMSHGEIEIISDGIYRFSRLSEGDGILAVSGETQVLKVGNVLHNNVSNHAAHVSIKWHHEIGQGKASRSVFLPKVEIQKVGIRILNSLSLPIRFKEPLTSQYKVVKGLSYESPIKMELLLHREERKEDQGGEVDLFFGTNRSESTRSDPGRMYGNQVGHLRYGTCKVSIPRGHLLGEMERPRKFLFMNFPENSSSHIVLQSVNELSEDDFYKMLDAGIKESTHRSALLFIHGYNTSFAEAARRTAQIAWDIPFDGVSGFFSWPSSGAAGAYAADYDKVEASISDFNKFIELFLMRTGAEKLHVIAHSMGSRLISTSLTNLSDVESLKSRLSVIGQIILAAPDIDQDTFRKNILPKFANIGLRRTLYSSDKDEAIGISERLRGGRIRLGDAGDSIFITSEMDTIDTSNLQTFGLSHSYLFDTKEMLNDLFYLLKFGFAPEDRRLRMMTKDSRTYWLFPK